MTKRDFDDKIENRKGGIWMLLQFSMRNHRSMKEKAVISMNATKDKSLAESLITPDGKRTLVPVLAIYGANAAGKSNVLHALFLMRDMICGKYAKLLKGESLPQEPFAFVEGKPGPTEFEIIYYYKAPSNLARFELASAGART